VGGGFCKKKKSLLQQMYRAKTFFLVHNMRAFFKPDPSLGAFSFAEIVGIHHKREHYVGIIKTGTNLAKP